MNQQSIQLSVWLGLPVLALVWANLRLWQTHRNLNRVPSERNLQHSRPVPAPAVADLTGSVLAR